MVGGLDGVFAYMDFSVAACAKALTFTWISCFWVPKKISSDHGPQITSNLWLQLCEMLNISHRQTTAYHPDNEAVKRQHCHLKDVLRFCTTAATWAEEIPWVLFGLLAQPREDTGLSPAEAMFGAPIALLNEFLQGDKIYATVKTRKMIWTLQLPEENWKYFAPFYNTLAGGLLDTQLADSARSRPPHYTISEF